MIRRLIITISIVCTITSCYPEKDSMPAPTIYFYNEGLYEIELDSVLVITPRITYMHDTTDSLWYDENNNIISNTVNLKFKPTKRKDYHFTFSIKNPRGDTSKDVSVMVIKGVTCDTLSNYNYKMRPNTINMKPIEEALIYNDIRFNNCDEDTVAKLWSGIIRSSLNSGSRLNSDFENRGCAYIRNNTGNRNNVYMSVCCENDKDAHIEFLNTDYIVKSIDITNDYAVFATSYEGTDTMQNMLLSQIPHSLSVIPYACDKDGNIITEGKPIKLIECFGGEDRSTITYIEKWTTIDLSYLGPMRSLKLKTVSDNEYIRPYFCMDNLKLQDP